MDTSSEPHKHDNGPDGDCHPDYFTTNGLDQEPFVLYAEDVWLFAANDCRRFIPITRPRSPEN